ncbi:VOC family protein [Aquihabitans sp. G128]|uniref:VOC family protein n=1 Tax=Aquihabitans sp. G128 TaxID=2849779 RepID=UPI001C231A27|nr:VOC family protein [Aquihabitans sp. G128]QXC59478.1 VOC family protein [Aquihabitans sp. G128]
MEPVLHLSLPVADLSAARDFYVDVLGCRLGRVREGWLDVWFFGMQLTLQEHPDQVLAPEQVGVRHFGATLGAGPLRELLARAEAAEVDWADPLHVDFAGTPQEQTKAKLRDPSGNVIELKSYADPAVALEQLERPD